MTNQKEKAALNKVMRHRKMLSKNWVFINNRHLQGFLFKNAILEELKREVCLKGHPLYSKIKKGELTPVAVHKENGVFSFAGVKKSDVANGRYFSKKLVPDMGGKHFSEFFGFQCEDVLFADEEGLLYDINFTGREETEWEKFPSVRNPKGQTPLEVFNNDKQKGEVA